MAKFNASEIDNYGGNGGSGYFSLKNDGETAQVRFMYNDINDVEGCAVHQVEIGDRKRYVNCLRSYNEPVSQCPFCRDGKFQVAKLFVPLYDIAEKRVKVWERGKKFFAKISSICARYANPSVASHIFEIERNGKPGDQTTSYELYEIEKDNTTLEDLPEVPDVLGGLVLDKSADDMEYYLENGEFPPEGEEAEPIRRRESSYTREETRRTPTSRRGNTRDRF